MFDDILILRFFFFCFFLHYAQKFLKIHQNKEKTKKEKKDSWAESKPVQERPPPTHKLSGRGTGIPFQIGAVDHVESNFS